jgi:hypothetical protein
VNDTERRIRLARVALQLGPLFPLQNRRKDPLPGSHGCHDAVDDVAQVERWIRMGRNVGLHTVLVFVLDVDLRSGGDRTLADLEQRHGKLPDTPRQFTGGGGGVHHFFVLPEGVRYRPNIGPGLDVKAGSGAYVVVSPSAVTRPYVWDESPEHCELAELPGWLFRLAARRLDEPGAPPTGPVAGSVLALALQRSGLVRFQRGERIAVRCPWEMLHTGKERHQDTSTVVFPPSARRPLGSFHCSHAHCAGRTAAEVLDELDPAIVQWAMGEALEMTERTVEEDAVRGDAEEDAAVRWEAAGCPEESAA